MGKKPHLTLWRHTYQIGPSGFKISKYCGRNEDEKDGEDQGQKGQMNQPDVERWNPVCNPEIFLKIVYVYLKNRDKLRYFQVIFTALSLKNNSWF